MLGVVLEGNPGAGVHFSAQNRNYEMSHAASMAGYHKRLKETESERRVQQDTRLRITKDVVIRGRKASDGTCSRGNMPRARLPEAHPRLEHCMATAREGSGQVLGLIR